LSAPWIHVESLAEVGVAKLSPDESRHVAARRLRAGDPVVAFDGAGRIAAARIETLGRRGAELRIESIEQVAAEGDHWLLATAIPKGERLAAMRPMLVQLGVPVWQPLVLDDSAVRDLDVASPRIERILIESAKVARRAFRMEVRAPMGLDALLASPEAKDGLWFGDRAGESAGVGGTAAVIAIGPEAGFSVGELDRLRGAGARACALGPHNLRIETAAVAAAVARFVAGPRREQRLDG
jgi:16S rRNA (uracil1498-N3)-methyltransferase